MPSGTPPKDMQFRLSTLVIGMTVAAVLLGLASPWLQRLQPAARWFVVRWTGLYFLMFVGLYFSTGFERRRLIRKAGRLRFTRTSAGQDGKWMSGCGLVVFQLANAGLFALLAFMVNSATATSPASDIWLLEFSMLIMAVASLGLLVNLYDLQGNTPLICEKGVLRERRLIPWAEFDRWSWNPHHPNSVMLRGGKFLLEIEVVPQERERVAEMLNQEISAEA